MGLVPFLCGTLGAKWRLHFSADESDLKKYGVSVIGTILKLFVISSTLKGSMA